MEDLKINDLNFRLKDMGINDSAITALSYGEIEYTDLQSFKNCKLRIRAIKDQQIMNMNNFSVNTNLRRIIYSVIRRYKHLVINLIFYVP